MSKSDFSIISFIGRAVAYLSLLALLFVYIAPYVSPITGGLFSMFGLVAPVVIAINVLFAVYWLMRMDKLAIAFVVLLLAGIGYSTRIIRIPVLKDKRPEGTILKIVTFNAHCLTSKKDYSNVLSKTINAFDTIDAGIICFQEFMTTDQHLLNSANEKLKKYSYRYVHNIEDRAGFGRDNYMAIYSKHKIINKGYIDFGDETINGSIYADVIYRGDTVRIVNNHLQTSNVTGSDIRFLTGQDGVVDESEDSQSFYRLFTIIFKLRVNNKIRAVQADSIQALINRTTYPLIVCGDHNDTPITYSYNTIRGDLKDAFVEKGKWYGYTFKPFAQLLRIDYVFHSEKFTTVSYLSPNILWSDHKPVIVEVKYNK